MISDEKRPTDAVSPNYKEDRFDRRLILDSATRAVTGQREQDYGSPERNFGMIATFWNIYMVGKFGPESPQLQGSDVGLMLALLKIARATNGYIPDNYIDLAGYAACAGELAKNEE